MAESEKNTEKYTKMAKDACRYVGEAMKTLRTKRKKAEGGLYTQEYMSQKIGCTRSQISDYERGADKIPVYAVIMYAEILGIDIKYFFPESIKDEEVDKGKLVRETEEDRYRKKIISYLPRLSLEYLRNISNNIVYHLKDKA